MNPEDPLPPRARIGSFEILRVLGQGASAFTYFARDLRTDGLKVAIKEFFPQRLVYRAPTGAVVQRKGAPLQVLQRLYSRFHEEGDLLRMLKHPNLCSGMQSIEANGSVYHVMKYETGTSLRALLRQNEFKLPQRPDLFRNIINGLLDGLEELHASGFLHCDIKPSNIFVGADGKPVLIDLGSALKFGPEGVVSRDSIEWTDHYAPKELLSASASNIGPWTDLYSLSAVFYRCASGGKIPKTEERDSDFDPYLRLSEMAPKGVGRELCSVVDSALQVNSGNRPASVSSYRDILGYRWKLGGELDRAKEVSRDLFNKGLVWFEEKKRSMRDRSK